MYCLVNSFRPVTRTLLSLLCGLMPLFGAQRSAAQAATEIPAKLRMADTGRVLDVVLTGRRGDMVYYRFKGMQEDVTSGSNLRDIEAARLDLEFDREAMERAAAQGNWLEAARAMFPAVLPVLPFLVLPDSEPPRLARQAAVYLMRAGVVQRGGYIPDPGDSPAEREYLAAHRILEALLQSPHASYHDEAGWRTVTCLIMTGRIDEAEEAMTQLSVPPPGDRGYAHSALARSQMHRLRGDVQRAMDHAIQALAFDTKDIDTFPEALFLAAQCYQDLGEWYRARDTYFEVARLFRRTDWFAPALEELRTIMADGHTAEDEPHELHRVFFGTTEDVNERVNDFLAALEPTEDNGGTEQ